MSQPNDNYNDLAMDDSIDSESFRNSSIGSGGQKNIHGSHLSSNASRASSRQSSGHSVNHSKLLNPFQTLAKADASDHLARSESSSSRFSAPSAKQKMSARHTSISDGESGVLVGGSGCSSGTAEQFPDLSAILSDDNPSEATKRLRPSLVSYEGSPLPRFMKGTHSHRTYDPSPLRSFAAWRVETGAASDTSSRFATKLREASLEASRKQEAACGWGCCNSYRGPAKSEMQPYCRTATPSPSENDVAERCDGWGCWGCGREGCMYVQDRFPTTSEGNSERASRASRGSPTHATTPKAVHEQHWSEAASSAPSQKSDRLPADADAPGLSGWRETQDLNEPVAVPPPVDAPHTVVNANCCHADQAKTIKAKAGESKVEPIDPAAFSNGFQIDHETSLRNLETRVVKRLDLLDAKLRLGDGGQQANAQNNIASVSCDGWQASSLSRADLDLRDLNKSVLKMHFQEKLKREQDLIDRLARIEGELAAKQAIPGNNAAITPDPKELDALRYHLMQQRQEIDDLRKDVGLMPEVRGELVNLNNEAMWTRERINNLENVACEQQRGLHYAVQRHEPMVAEAHVNNSAANSINPIRGVKWSEPHGWTVPFSAARSGPIPASASGCEWRAGSQVSFDEGATLPECDWGLPAPQSQGYRPLAFQRDPGWGARAQSPFSGCENSQYPAPRTSYPARQGGQGWEPTGNDRDGGGWGHPSSCRSGSEALRAQNDVWGNPYSLDFPSNSPTAMRDDQNAPRMIYSRTPIREQSLYDYGATYPQWPAESSWCYPKRRAYSYDARSHVPTIETIVDEKDEFRLYASRTQSHGWDMVSSRPSTITVPTANSRDFDRSSTIRSGEWVRLGPKQTSQASKSPSDRPSSAVRSAGDGFARGRGEAPPTNWVSAGGWDTASNSPRRSTKESREHWRCPTTQSKWEGESGRDEENFGGWD